MKKDKLHNIKENGFKTPKGYFDTLEDHIIDELKLKEALPDKPGFKVPDNYFNSIEAEIIARASSQAKEKEVKVIKLFSRKNIIYATSIAAAILLLFSLSIFENKPSFDKLDNETVENYILNENIDSYEIASLLNEEDLVEENFVEFNIDDEVIEDYILNNIEVEDLY